jgi:hypothetical protein
MSGMRRAAVLVVGLLVAGAVTIVWGLPAVYGPPIVTCHDIGQLACERAWRAEAAQDGVLQLLPVTQVTIWGHGGCNDGEIDRADGLFSRAWSELC